MRPYELNRDLYSSICIKPNTNQKTLNPVVNTQAVRRQLGCLNEDSATIKNIKCISIVNEDSIVEYNC